jgi:hypothetical protein
VQLIAVGDAIWQPGAFVEFEDIRLILLQKAGLELAVAFLRADHATTIGRLPHRRRFGEADGTSRKCNRLHGRGGFDGLAIHLRHG